MYAPGLRRRAGGVGENGSRGEAAVTAADKAYRTGPRYAYRNLENGLAITHKKTRTSEGKVRVNCFNVYLRLPTTPSHIRSRGKRDSTQHFSEARRAQRMEFFLGGNGQIGIAEGIRDDDEAARVCACIAISANR